jgi:hypothetical protein
MKDKPPPSYHCRRASLFGHRFNFGKPRVYRELDPVDQNQRRTWYWSTVWGGDVACWRCGNSTQRGSQCQACEAENCMFLLFTTDRTNPFRRITNIRTMRPKEFGEQRHGYLEKGTLGSKHGWNQRDKDNDGNEIRSRRRKDK